MRRGKGGALRRGKTGAERKGRRLSGREVKRLYSRPGRCALCGKPVEDSEETVSLGTTSRIAHLRCVVRYEFSVLGERR